MQHACAGPRSWALARDQRDGLDAMLDATDVLLLTQVRHIAALLSQCDVPSVSLQRCPPQHLELEGIG